MPTGHSITSRCTARAALAGNPSDGYGGAVLSVPIPDLCAMASATEADEFSVHAGDPELARLLQGAAAGFRAVAGGLPNVTLGASTTIPRSVGLAGSSALIIAALRALGAWAEHRWEAIGLAELALAVERDHLGIEAGLQDRLVQAVGRPVAMTFDPVGFELVDLSDVPLFVAWATASAEPSDTVHRSLRRRFDAGDPTVTATMQALADQARDAQAALESGDIGAFGDAVNRTFELRRAMIDVDPALIELVRVGRKVGAAVNSAGSGGSVVGLVKHRDDLERVRAAYERAGAEFLEIR